MEKYKNLFNQKTDKFNWCHGYTEKYNDLFKEIRLQNLNILEIGIGYKEMPSLRLWKDYFPNSTIHGIDIASKYIDNSVEGISTYLCSSLNSEEVDSILKPAGPFDIIIDDGCHRCDGQQISFMNMFNLLAEGGMYIIEDCGYSFNPKCHFNGDIDPVNLTYTIGPPDDRILSDLPKWCIINNRKNISDTTISVFENYKKTGKLDNFYFTTHNNKEEVSKTEEKIKDIEIWYGKTKSDSLIVISSN